MRYKNNNFLIINLIIILLLISTSNFVSTENTFITAQSNFEINSIIDIEPSSQRLSFQIDEFQNRHFIYLTGERPMLEPDAVLFNGTHVLKYGIFVDNELLVENVTDDLVFPYHYEFRVDALGQVHIAYIANNYTLYYSVRDPVTSTWTKTKLNQPSEMFAMMPAITLGNNEQPRIVYSVRYQEKANLFFNQTGELTNLSSLFYTVLSGSTWLYYDVGDNHAASIFSQRDISVQRIYNPGIKIEKGFAYIAFTNKVSLAVETRMQYIKIPEFPEDIAFLPLIHQRAKIAPSQASTYRRPSIHLVDDSILLAFGAWTFGGGSVIYLTNASVLQDPNPDVAKNEWLKSDLLRSGKLNKQIDSVVGVQSLNGTIFLTWSLYDLSNAQTMQFSHDVFLATLHPTSTEIGFDPEVDVQRLTETNQIHHYSPNIAVTKSDDLLIYYILENQNDGGTKLIETSPTGLITETQINSEIITKTAALRTPLSIFSIFFAMSFITFIVIYSRKRRSQKSLILK